MPEYQRYFRKKSLVVKLLLMAGLILLSACDRNALLISDSHTVTSLKSSDKGRQLKGNMYLSGVPILKNKKAYSMLITYSLNNVDPNEMGVHKKLEQRSNVKMVYDFVLPTTVRERKATMFASGQYTDTIGGDALSNADVVTYGADELLIPLESLIEQYMPRLRKILEQNPEIKKTITAPDGHIYALPSINYRSAWPDPQHHSHTQWNINKKWLQKLNLQVPKTTNELVQVLKAFRDNDPNGNGKKDEIPMSYLANDNINGIGLSLYPAFGFVDYAGHMDVINGKVVNVATLPQYREAVLYLNNLCKEGLLDKEIFTMNYSRYAAKVGQKDPVIVGVFSAYGGYAEVGSDRILEDYEDILPLIGPAGKQLWGRANAGLNCNKLAITSACRDPEVIARWADELYDPEISVEIIYGMIGRQIEKLGEGKYRITDPPAGVTSEEWRRTDTTRVLPSAVMDADSVSLAKDNQTKMSKSLKYKEFVDKEIFPQTYFTKEETDVLQELDASINAFIDQKTAEWVLGKSDINRDWDSFQAQLKQKGVERSVQIRQQIMDRFNRN